MSKKNLFSTNIRFLRNRRGRTQEVAAHELKISRSTMNSYENGSVKNPTLEALLDFSNYYRMPVDTLIRIDLEKLHESSLREIEIGHEAYIKGNKLRVLVTTVDSNNNENIELVPFKASAGYTQGYNDPEYISSLPTFQLPFLSREKKYRSFQIRGDSMLPIPDKAYITTEYVQNWNDVKDGQAYVVVTADDGIVFKVVYNQVRNKKKLLLRSLNPAYKPYEVNVGDVKEIWRFVNYINNQVPDAMPDAGNLEEIAKNLKNEISRIGNLMKK
jgi:transcriptional regulator with XRE-family HTH domain